MWKYKPFVMPAPAPLLEKDLPPGVEYRPSPLFDTKCSLVALADCRRFWRRNIEGDYVYDWSGERRESVPVVILDWPSWCGPRPDQSRPITYADIREQAPTHDAVVVFMAAKGANSGAHWTSLVHRLDGGMRLTDTIPVGYHYWEPDHA